MGRAEAAGPERLFRTLERHCRRYPQGSLRSRCCTRGHRQRRHVHAHPCHHQRPDGAPHLPRAIAQTKQHHCDRPRFATVWPRGREEGHQDLLRPGATFGQHPQSDTRHTGRDVLRRGPRQGGHPHCGRKTERATGPLFTDYSREFIHRQGRRWKPSTREGNARLIARYLLPFFGKMSKSRNTVLPASSNMSKLASRAA